MDNTFQPGMYCLTDGSELMGVPQHFSSSIDFDHEQRKAEATDGNIFWALIDAD